MEMHNVKTCKYTDTKDCPFDDSDMGPPFAGSVKKCDHLNGKYYCKYFLTIKNADAIYANNISLHNKLHPVEGKIHKMIRETILKTKIAFYNRMGI